VGESGPLRKPPERNAFGVSEKSFCFQNKHRNGGGKDFGIGAILKKGFWREKGGMLENSVDERKRGWETRIYKHVSKN